MSKYIRPPLRPQRASAGNGASDAHTQQRQLIRVTATTSTPNLRSASAGATPLCLLCQHSTRSEARGGLTHPIRGACACGVACLGHLLPQLLQLHARAGLQHVRPCGRTAGCGVRGAQRAIARAADPSASRRSRSAPARRKYDHSFGNMLVEVCGGGREPPS